MKHRGTSSIEHMKILKWQPKRYFLSFIENQNQKENKYEVLIIIVIVIGNIFNILYVAINRKYNFNEQHSSSTTSSLKMIKVFYFQINVVFKFEIPAQYHLS